MSPLSAEVASLEREFARFGVPLLRPISPFPGLQGVYERSAKLVQDRFCDWIRTEKRIGRPDDFERYYNNAGRKLLYYTSGGFPTGALRMFDNQESLFPSHRGGSFKDVIALRLILEVVTEQTYFQSHAMPVLDPVSHQTSGALSVYPLQDCISYLLEHSFPGDKTLAVSPYRFRFDQGTRCRLLQTLLEQVEPLDSYEPVRENDLIFYYSNPGDRSLNLMPWSHVGWVAFVEGENTWVDSKWYYSRRPCLHRVQDVPTDSYGTAYHAARFRVARPQTLPPRNFQVPDGRVIKPEEISASVNRLEAIFRSAGEDYFYRHF